MKVLLLAVCLFACFLSCDSGDPAGVPSTTYAVTYDGNGNTGGSVPASQTKSQGVALTLAGNTGNLVKTGLNFTGWNTSANGSGTDYAEGASYTADANVTLYAKWTVENLRTTKYNDGSSIPYVTDVTQWSNLTTPGYCFYNNTTNTADHTKWGALYNWLTVNTAKLAPGGWHVPTDSEWTVLENYLIANGYNWDGSTSGNEIGKSLAATTDWDSNIALGAVGNDIASNNSTRFSALPGGCRSGYGGHFNDQSNIGFWWSATEGGASGAWDRGLYYGNSDLGRSDNNKRFGFSVRLVRD